MYFAGTLLATLCAVAASASPIKRDDCATPDSTYKISDLTLRKSGDNISTMFFDISATNEGTLDFQCSPYDPSTNAAATSFTTGQIYSCGEHSFFSFSYVDGKGQSRKTNLYLWQDVSDTTLLAGNAIVPRPVCRAGGAGMSDQVCTTQRDFEIAMYEVKE